MAATLIVVNLNGQTLAQHTLQTGSVQRIAAMNNVHYQLADPQSGLAAQGVQASKAGEDLLVHINGEPALIIEDYFLLDNSGLKNPLLGLNGSGQYVAYPVGDASALSVEHLLAEEVAGAATASTTSAAAINPAIALATIGGVALTGAVIAGGSKNDSKSVNNTPQNQPQTPFDPNQPAPPVDNGNINPPPSDSGNITPPPSGGGNPPPPSQPGNTTPTDLDISAVTLPENVPGAVIGKVTVTDPDQNDSHTFAVSDNRFEVDAQGNLKLKNGEKVDYANEQSINLTITVSDAAGASYEESFTIAVQDDPNYPTPQNHAPTDIQLSAMEVMEGKAGIVIGRLTTVDPDQGDTHTYTVDDTRFEIVSGELKLKAGQVLNYDDAQNITLNITSNDGKGGSYSEEFTLSVQDDPNYPAPQNQAPRDLDLSALQLPENTPGAVIGKVTVTDPDQNDSHTFAVSDNRFEVDAQGNLKLKNGEKVDYANEQSINLTITVSDAAGASYEESFTIAVQDDPNYPAPTPTPPANSAETFAKTHIPAGEAYQIVANLKEAKAAAANPALKYLVISDGEHHALVQKGGQGTDIGLAGWKADFTKAGYVPVVAFHDGNANITAALNTALKAGGKLAAAQGKNIAVHMPESETYTTSDTIHIPNKVLFYGNDSTLKTAASVLTAVQFDPTANANQYTAKQTDIANPDLAKASAALVGLNIEMSAPPKSKSIAILANDTTGAVIKDNVAHHLAYHGIIARATDQAVENIYIINNKVRTVEGQMRDDWPAQGIQITGKQGTGYTDGTILSTLDSHQDSHLSAGTLKAIADARRAEIAGGKTRFDQAIKVAIEGSTESGLWVNGGGIVLNDSETRYAKNFYIIGNDVDGGRYGIGVERARDGVIENNSVTNNTRNVVGQHSVSGLVIKNNLLTEGKSAGVLLGHNADHNLVEGNIITSTKMAADGQGQILIFQGSEHNTVRGNFLENTGGGNKWIINASTDASYTVIENNVISGKTRGSAIQMEAVWDGVSAHPTGKVAADQTSSYTTSAYVKSYLGGNGPSINNKIQGNLIVPNAEKHNPVLYLAAETSRGAKHLAPQSPKFGHLSVDVEDNIVLGTQYGKLIVEHEGSLPNVGQSLVNGKSDATRSGVSHIAGNVHRDGDDVYAIADYTLQDGESNLLLLGNAANLKGNGNAGNNTLIGNMLQNTLNGGDGNDVIDGGYGADTLTGGKGADAFVFQSRVDGKNIDTITDFNRGEGDKIALSEVLFGTLEGDWFAQDGEAHTDATRIYQQGDTLYYDADGKGGLAGTAFANIGQAKLDDQDFILLNKLLIL